MDTKNIIQIPIEDIVPNRFQPRLAFNNESLKELAASIKEHGIIQPVVVRRLNDKYELIAGERRYRASKLIGLVSVPAIITEMTDQKSAEVAIVENVQRKNLTAIEEAKSYKALLEQRLMSQEDLAKKMGVSQSAISNKLRLLSLADEVQDAIMNEKISERHARTLLKLKDHPDQIKYLNKIISERLTVKHLEDLIKEEKPEIVAPKEIKVEDIETVNTNNEGSKFFGKKEYPNKFFNFLESEGANMSLTNAPAEPVKEEPAPVEEIEMLDDFFAEEPKKVELERSPLNDEIKSFLTKYPNVMVEERNDGINNIITLKIPNE